MLHLIKFGFPQLYFTSGIHEIYIIHKIYVTSWKMVYVYRLLHCVYLCLSTIVCYIWQTLNFVYRMSSLAMFGFPWSCVTSVVFFFLSTNVFFFISENVSFLNRSLRMANIEIPQSNSACVKCWLPSNNATAKHFLHLVKFGFPQSYVTTGKLWNVSADICLSWNGCYIC